MRKKDPENSWGVKRLQREQQRYIINQKKQDEYVIDRLNKIEDRMKDTYSVFEGAFDCLGTKIDNSNKDARVIIDRIVTLSETLEQTQELIKILVANQLIDEIK